MKEYQSDVCIIGSGVCGVLAAEKLAREPDLTVLLVEAGRRIEPKRKVQPGENPHPGDVITDQIAKGAIMQTMCVGGRATHWGGECPRYSPEDFRGRSLIGVGEDWPITYEDLEPHYAAAEIQLGVSGKASVEGSDLRKFQEWAATAGLHTVPTPHATDGKRTYSPVPTLERLLKRKNVQLISGTLIRRLELESKGDRVARATGVEMNSAAPVSISATHFLLAGSYVWTPHLLLLSANSRFPDGLANKSGLVGRYITGHPEQGALFELGEQFFTRSSIYSSQFLAPPAEGPPTRFGLYLYASSAGPRVRDPNGRIMLGDEILKDWRAQRTRVNVKTYLSVAASPESRLFLDESRKNRWGDPLPTVNDFANREAAAISQNPPRRLQSVLEDLGRHSIRQVGPLEARMSIHPSGGCRMGVDATSSVCDELGRCHDHENVFILGAPTCVSGGCVNSTLTFVALALRSAGEVGKAFPRLAKRSARPYVPA
jgi:quinoprotein glucose dehydrogenase